MKKVSIIIPVLNESNRIERWHKKYIRSKLSKNFIEILIFDNGCTDNTIAIAKNICKIISFHNQRPENSHTQALKISNADVFVIFAADNVMTSKLWLKMIKPFEDENIGCSFTHIKVDKNDFHQPVLPIFTR